MHAWTAREVLARGAARVCDNLIDFFVLAFGAWTAIYHVALILHVGALWSAVAEAAAVLPCGWIAFRLGGSQSRATAGHDLHRLPCPASILRAVGIFAALGAAGLFAFADVPWPAIWAFWVAAAGAVAITVARRPAVIGSIAGQTDAHADDARPSWLATLVAITWAIGLAALSLFLVKSDGDDVQYVHMSSWVAAHGEFPLRDTLFTDQVLPAIFYPPLSSFEALAGTVARVTSLGVPSLVYLVVPTLATALSVLATWRLLRGWGPRMVGLALSVAMVFLLLDAQGHRTVGSFFIGRMWQGKTIFVAVLIPALFALLIEYFERPTRRHLLLLAAAGASGVGLTSTAVFVVPAVAAGCLVALVGRSWRHGAAGLAATVAYPLAAACATAFVGARNPANAPKEAIDPSKFAHAVFGVGVVALIAVTAILVGPILIRRALAARMAAGTGLLVACLLGPSVPMLLLHVSGLGRVQWRFMWAIPTAALVGVLGTAALGRMRMRALRWMPAAVLCLALAVWGAPVWSADNAHVAAKPAWKRPAESIGTARRILARARPGDTVLAPELITDTILVMSGTVTSVAPRPRFYTLALREVPGGHAFERLLLQSFAKHGLGAPVIASAGRIVKASDVARALRVLDVDVACLKTPGPSALRVVKGAGYSQVLRVRSIVCLRSTRG